MTNEDLWSKVAQPGRLNDQQHIEMMNKLLRAYASEVSNKK